MGNICSSSLRGFKFRWGFYYCTPENVLALLMFGARLLCAPHCSRDVYVSGIQSVRVAESGANSCVEAERCLFMVSLYTKKPVHI